MGTVATARAADARFSQALTAAESAETGLNRLSSDQIAVIDALVRRDLAGQNVVSPKDPPRAERFSQRLTPDERRIAGFALLTEAELLRLDALVSRQEIASQVRALLGPPVFATASPRLRPTETKTNPEVHGSFSLGMGWGKGYSERTGSMMLNYDDPAHGFSVSVGYSETHLKGGTYIYRDPSFVPSAIGP